MSTRPPAAAWAILHVDGFAAPVAVDRDGYVLGRIGRQFQGAGKLRLARKEAAECSELPEYLGELKDWKNVGCG